MKKKGINLESSIEKLESEVRLYHDVEALISSYRESGDLSDKDIISVIERVKFQILIDSIKSQIGIKDKLDSFTRKWNLFSRQDKKNDPIIAAKDQPLNKIEKIEQWRDNTEITGDIEQKKKDSDKLFSKLKRKFKMSRCENCGYFYVHDAEKEIYQCTFFEFSSQVGKKDVCENWTDGKKFQQPFF